MSKEPEPRARRRAPRRVIDWHRAAELVAEGMPTAEVARHIGCAHATLSRKRKHDAVFQGWLARCREDQVGQDGQRLSGLRPTLLKAIEEEVRVSNMRVVLWLADRLKLVTPPSEHTPDQELRRLLGALTSEELMEFEQLRDET
jgi:hypothetical protein